MGSIYGARQVVEEMKSSGEFAWNEALWQEKIRKALRDAHHRWHEQYKAEILAGMEVLRQKGGYPPTIFAKQGRCARNTRDEERKEGRQG